ncbi:hypothetical protein EYC79_14555 [Agrobacterium cavarae]|uniref:Uncharacterized protein n=1 Tax=Agrobacterium cavarae TaxID=2528239 RepID=A0ABY1Y6S7_9HYPH|nr:hypothetical protein [Agrobacterium cavarae]TBN11468.1 hypothetical protein EYC79_14555 [Agrobacterium cavarae]
MKQFVKKPGFDAGFFVAMGKLIDRPRYSIGPENRSGFSESKMRRFKSVKRRASHRKPGASGLRMAQGSAGESG